jgi:ribosomal protein S18 acetylase RimI-like enzyme
MFARLTANGRYRARVIEDAPIEDPSVGALLAFEARAHRWPERTVSELAGGLLVHDPADPDPIFNRLVNPSWPADQRDADQRGWDRWLAPILAAFERLKRRPHLWLVSEPDDPRLERLGDAGFEVIGASRYMALASAERVHAEAERQLPGVQLERVDGRSARPLRAAGDVAAIVADAFDLEPALHVLVEADIVRMLDVPTIGFVLARLGGEPVAVARRTTDGTATLLAAIGTRRGFRDRGLARLVTATAAVDALAAGSRTIYLGVEDGNEAAQHLYRGLGFRFAAGNVVAVLRR